MSLLISYIIHSVILAAISPALIGAIRKYKALYQGRTGASIFQPYRNLRKLFSKDEVLPEDASWIFRVAPYIVFGTTLSVAAGVPLLVADNTGTLGNIFVFIYTLALGTFFLALAGIDAGSSFGGFGSSREMTFSAIAEGVLLFSLLPLALLAHSTNMGDIASHIHTMPLAHLLPVAVAFIGFFIALLAENARIPIDNPATHLELTMVHEAMILEYSGKRLALMEWASALKLTVFTTLALTVFIPWGAFDTTDSFTLTSVLLATGILVGKFAIFALSIATIESVIAKLRIFRIPNLLFTAFIIGAVAFALTTL